MLHSVAFHLGLHCLPNATVYVGKFQHEKRTNGFILSFVYMIYMYMATHIMVATRPLLHHSSFQIRTFPNSGLENTCPISHVT